MRLSLLSLILLAIPALFLSSCRNTGGPYGIIHDVDGKMLSTRKPELVRQVHANRLTVNLREVAGEGWPLIATIDKAPSFDFDMDYDRWQYKKPLVTIHCDRAPAGKQLSDLDKEALNKEVRRYFTFMVARQDSVKISYSDQAATDINPYFAEADAAYLKKQGGTATSPTPVATAKTEADTAKHASSEAKSKGMTYLVRKGDTLANISHAFYGSYDNWPDIVAANDSLSSPADLKPGMKLIIPKLKP